MMIKEKKLGKTEIEDDNDRKKKTRNRKLITIIPRKKNYGRREINDDNDTK